MEYSLFLRNLTLVTGDCEKLWRCGRFCRLKSRNFWVQFFAVTDNFHGFVSGMCVSWVCEQLRRHRARIKPHVLTYSKQSCNYDSRWIKIIELFLLRVVLKQIIFDECHRAKNLNSGGLNGKGTKTGRTVVELQKRLPNARIVYASAPGERLRVQFRIQPAWE